MSFIVFFLANLYLIISSTRDGEKNAKEMYVMSFPVLIGTLFFNGLQLYYYYKRDTSVEEVFYLLLTLNLVGTFLLLIILFNVEGYAVLMYLTGVFCMLFLLVTYSFTSILVPPFAIALFVIGILRWVANGRKEGVVKEDRSHIVAGNNVFASKTLVLISFVPLAIWAFFVFN